MSATPHVTLDVWRLRRRHLPAALARVATTRYDGRRPDGPAFGKLLGTAGPGFSPTDPTPRRWALLAAWPDARAAERFRRSGAARWWQDRSVESATLSMRPLRARGRWDGRAPFGEPADDGGWPGPVVVVTRARLRAAAAVRFYVAVPAVAREVAAADGLLVAFGVGEAPLLRQGTVSVWESAARLRAFTDTAAAHADAVRRTPLVGWYAEDLFARFALVDATGTIDGRSVR